MLRSTNLPSPKKTGVSGWELINAGLIPFFNENGYAVFKMRPRPPWSIKNPTQAFKDSILRDVNLPLFQSADLDILKKANDQLRDAPAAQRRELENLIARFEAKIKGSSGVEDFRAYLKKYHDRPLTEYISQIQSMLNPESRILFICDQFEELFVHYGNTPEMDEFVSQLGQVWADDSLRVHLLFSMREDWVGSMIEFRKAIPDIFGNYFKLNPITFSSAKDVLKVPLKTVNISFEDNAVGQILSDLAQAYQIDQKRRLSEVMLTPSPKDDPFIELPALQVLADKLWSTKDEVVKPFSVTHYQSLKSAYKPVQVVDESTSPARVVLDNYLLDLLANIKDSDKLTPQEWRDLRIDCAYLLTDRTRHRRALPENLLLEELRQIRPQGLDLPEIDRGLLLEAIEPLVKVRLVREEITKDGQKQYELAHDFAVRSGVRNWRELDRARISELAILQKEKKEKEEKYTELEKGHQRTFRFLQLAPLLSILLLLISAFSAGELRSDRNLFQINTILSLLVILPFTFILIVGLLKEHKFSIRLGSIGGSASIAYVLVQNDELAITILVPLSIFTFLMSFRSAFDISLRIKDPPLIPRIFGTLWSELIGMISISVIILIGAINFAIFDEILGFSEDDSVRAGAITGIIFLVVMFHYNARHISGKGYPFFCKGIDLHLKTREGMPLPVSSGHVRQWAFLIWLTAVLALAAMPAFQLGASESSILWAVLSIVLWAGGGALILKRTNRHVYDLVSGTHPLFRDESLGIHASKHESGSSRTVNGTAQSLMEVLTSTTARVLFGISIAFIGVFSIVLRDFNFEFHSDLYQEWLWVVFVFSGIGLLIPKMVKFASITLFIALLLSAYAKLSYL